MRLIRFVIAVVVVCLPLSGFAAAPLTDFIAAANHLHLGAEIANVSNATYSVAHMKIHFDSGSAARVLAGSEVIGIYFKGSGSFEYETVEAAELPVVDHNVKAVAHVKMTADATHATLSGNFTDVLLLSAGVPMLELSGTGGAPLADAFSQHIEAVFNRLVNKWKAEAAFGLSVAPIPYANRIEGDQRESFRQRNALLYNKGPYLLYVINKEIGDTQFLTFMKSYTKSFNFKFGTTKDVAGLLTFITKKDYKPFFDQYFWGTAMPH